MKNRIFLLLKVAISLGLIAIVLHAFDVRGVAGHFARVDVSTLLLAVGIALAIALLHTARWVAVIRAGRADFGYAAALRLILIGHFFNQALPSSIGGDAIRIWCAYRAGLPLRDAANSVIVDRMFTMASLLLFIAAALPWLLGIVEDAVARWALLTVLLAGIAGFGVFLALARVPPFMTHWRLAHAMLGVTALARAVMSDACRAPAVILLSATSFIGFAIIVFLLARAMGLEITLADCVVLVPPVILVSVLPISIAGWGVREGAMVAAFGFVDVPASGAFAVSVLFGLTLAAASVPGSLLWWRGGYSVSRVAADAENHHAGHSKRN